MSQSKKTRKTNGKSRTTSPAKKKAGGSRKARPSGGKAGSNFKHGGATEAVSAGEREVTIDRRRAHLRIAAEGAAAPAPAASAPKLERRKKVNRRRQIDPTTCERDYTGDEIEFMNALDDYKRKSGRMFPTCSEVLEVVRSLGYAKQLGSAAADGPSPDPFASATAETWPAHVVEEAETAAF